MTDATVGGQTADEFSTEVARKAVAKGVAECALEGLAVSPRERDLMRVAAVAAVIIISEKLTAAGVSFTDQGRAAGK